MLKWLKKRLIIYIASVFLVILMLIMSILYLVIEKSLYDNAKSSSYSIANSIYIALKDTIFNSAQLITLIGNDPYLKNYFFNDEPSAEAPLVEYLQNINSIYNKNIFIASFETNNLYSASGIKKTFDMNNPDDNWYFALSDSREELSGYKPIINNNGDRIILNNIQFITDTQGKTNGFAIYSIDYTNSLLKIKDSVKALKALVYVINSDGTQENYLLNTLNSETAMPLSLKDLDMPENTDSLVQIIKNKTSITYKYIDEIDSYLVIVQNLSTPLFNIFIVTLMIIIFILACLLLITLKLFDYSNKKIYDEASLDPLTNLYNRSAFNTKITEALELSTHYQITSSLIFIDIDSFKKINDEMGHHVGDEILQNVALILNESKRNDDHLFRWGGDEFIIIARSNLENTIQFAERLLNNVRKIYWKENENVTLSIGITEICPQDNKKLVFQRVDEALYKSKANGKNQIQWQ